MIFRYKHFVILAMSFYLFISSGWAQFVTNRFLFDNDCKQAWLGVEIVDVTHRLKKKKHLHVDEGAYVRKVVEESPAEEAGIKRGDVIVRFDGKNVEDANDLIRAVRNVEPNSDVKIEVVRKSERKTVTATLDRKPSPLVYSFKFDDFDAPSFWKKPLKPFRFRYFSREFFFGMELQTLTKQLGEYFEVPEHRGILVTEVKKGSRADEAGFQAGDVIITVEGERVYDVDDLEEEIDLHEGEEIKFDIIRRGKSISIKLQLEEGEEEEGDFSFHMIVPRGPCRIRSYRMEIPHHYRWNLDELKGEIEELVRGIEKKIYELQGRITETLREL